jgi:transposase-like protein
VRELEQENREVRRANEILKRAASFFGAELAAARSSTSNCSSQAAARVVFDSFTGPPSYEHDPAISGS